MNKKIIYLFSLVGLFCLAGLTSAQGITNPIGPNNFTDLLKMIITGVGNVIASLGTIMIIVAGILYLTSAGSPEKIATAKKALIYAIAGIAIGVAASAITSIVTGILGAKT